MALWILLATREDDMTAMTLTRLSMSGDDRYRHVRIESDGLDGDECLYAVNLIMSLFQDRFGLYIRTNPVVSSDKDFATLEQRHRAHARFSFAPDGYDIPEIRPGKHIADEDI